MTTRPLARIVGAVLLLMPLGAARAQEAKPAAAKPDRAGDEQAIRTLMKTYVEAYNAGKADDLTALMTEDATSTDSQGNVVAGRTAIRDSLAASFAEAQGVTITGAIDTLRFFSPDVARVEGLFGLTTPGDEGPFQTGAFTMIAVRGGDGWKIAEISDVVDSVGPELTEEPTPAERLRDLEWMVGDWVDETDSARIRSQIRWADNRAYLVRTYSIELAGEKASSGTMILGWDPRLRQIKSWIFDSQGGLGEAVWTRVGENQWMVKAQGVRADGTPNSATQLHTLLSDDVVKSSSFDRIIGGEPAPPIDDVVMVRKAPAPALNGVAASPQPEAETKPEAEAEGKAKIDDTEQPAK